MKKKQINNRYEILRSLGEGGMGQVSLVADLQEEGREVALKSFRPVSTGGDELDLFKHEFLLLSSLHHPNVAEVHDFGVIEGTDDFFFTTEFVDGRRVPKKGTEREIPADLVLIAMGFTGPEQEALDSQIGTAFTSRGNVERASDYQTEVAGVFVAGDAGRGQSLIVWAIAEGRAAASAIDEHLMGVTSLPAPVTPTDVAIGLQPA